MTDLPLVNALIFASLGIAVFFTALAILSRALPFDIWKQIVDERNVAAAVLAGAVVLGLSWIIAATMH